MSTVQSRSVVLLVLACTAAGGGYLLRATVDRSSGPSEYARRIAQQVGEWRTLEEWGAVPEEIEVLGTRDIIHRSYVHPRYTACHLSVVRSENKRTGVHDPLTCFRGQGWETMQKRAGRLPLPDGRFVPITEIVVNKSGQDILVLFFFKTGPYFANDYWQQQLQVLWTQLFHGPSHSSLLRMETSMTREPIERARERLYAFAEALLPEIIRHIP